MPRLLTALAIAGAALVAPAIASADPAPFPYCAFDPTGNAGSWSDWCLPVGPQPGQPVWGNPSGTGTYNQPDMPWETATSPTTGNTVNPFAPGGSMW
ncbi:hypothetical protein [Mycolicibacter arupensis]|uniref:Pili structural subunit n=1 Tax=Mycolicibacter arupensis TaxID=342002 RepID=A0A5C7XGP6_9MYCO|nr:hypothetical protein [Mycolicibacter arupensis]TXI48120.1 MAG: hypothetical protein E6Q54_24140 [Mycolicibacter arupensis]